jgi:adenylate kinase family enzyme
MSKRSYVA